MNKLFKYDRAISSILYALKQLGGRTDMHKLCKILYFADQRHLSLYGRSITGDRYIAMQYGPSRHASMTSLKHSVVIVSFLRARRLNH